MKALRLYCNTSRLPRRIYLFAEDSEVATTFPNCFIFTGVDWNKYPDLLRKAEKQATDLKSYPVTAIPFGVVPTPQGDYAPIKATLQTLAKAGFINPEFAQLAEALLPAAESMSLFLNGKHYASPCMMCHDFMKHVYGKCDILPEHRKHCHFSLVFPSKTVGAAFQTEDTLAPT